MRTFHALATLSHTLLAATLGGALIACGGAGSGAGTSAGAEIAAPSSPSSPTEPTAPTAPATPASPTQPSGAAAPTPSGASRVLLGYWATWTRATLPPARIPWSKLTHVAQAFVTPTASGALADVEGYVDAELLSAAHAHGVKVVASVGGAGASFGFASEPQKRATLVRAMADLCATRGYDGIDLDWEFPTSASVADWTSLVRESRAALDAIRPGLTLSAAVGSGEHLSAALLPQPAIDALDWIGVMTYDFAGPWSKSSGHDAPLRRTPGGDGGAVADSIEVLTHARGVAPTKVLIGLPFYGYTFGGGQLDATPVSPSGGVDYRDLAAAPASDGWQERWDDAGRVPYRVRAASPGFASYDDPRSIGEKCAYAKGEALGGAIVWHLAGDVMADGSEPLLDAAQGCR